MISSVPALVIQRDYAATPQRVFDAWTTPELVKQFFSPGEHHVTDVTMDVRTGGSYSLTMVDEKGDVMTVRGTYREVAPPHRLVFSWRWDEDDPKDEFDTLVSLEFRPHAGGTKLTLTHEQLRSMESHDNHKGGWGNVLDALGRVV